MNIFSKQICFDEYMCLRWYNLFTQPKPKSVLPSHKILMHEHTLSQTSTRSHTHTHPHSLAHTYRLLRLLHGAPRSTDRVALCAQIVQLGEFVATCGQLGLQRVGQLPGGVQLCERGGRWGREAEGRWVWAMGRVFENERKGLKNIIKILVNKKKS